MKVFWSWQNDTAPKRNRHFIREALSEAIKSLAGDFDVDDADRPELDHATKNVPGLADISKSILDKIGACAVFVADLTPIATTSNGKAVANPNVAIELGWALHTPGWERIIVILNTADGWKAEDLPFDVRHRRALTYSLAEGADGPTRAAVKKQLVSDLAAAIRTNLKQHLAASAATRTIAGVAHKDGEPSLWAEAGDSFKHHDSFGHGHQTNVTLPAGPRGYIRIIPAGWKDGPPTVDDIAQLPTEQAPGPVAEGTDGGDFGATPEGYVRYWITERGAGDSRASANVAMYFEDTGEFWVTHGTAVGEAKDQKVLRLESLFAGWATTLRRANRVMDRFGASPVRKVEVGVTGMTDVRSPGRWEGDRRPARRPTLAVTRQNPAWGAAEQEAFLIEAFARLCNLFGLPNPKREESRAFVARNDPERPREET